VLRKEFGGLRRHEVKPRKEHVLYSTLTRGVARLSLLALTISAVLALAACGVRPEIGTEATTGATTATSLEEPCTEVRPGEYSCTDGQLPRDHVVRGCVIYSSVYSIDLWRCELE
jgi:hypothetical protein